VRNRLHIILILCLYAGLNSCSSEKEQKEDDHKIIETGKTLNIDDSEQEALTLYEDPQVQIIFNEKYANKEILAQRYVEIFKDRKTPATKVQRIGELTYFLTYLPKEYMISNELRKNQISQEEYKKLSEEYGDLTYYLMEIEADDRQELARHKLDGNSDYTERIKYLSFEMEQNIKVKGENAEYPCVLFHYERTYNVSPKNTFLLGFEVPEEEKENKLQMIIDDQLFNAGFIKFTWKPEDIKNLPKLKLS
jgi:hypothetical protein